MIKETGNSSPCVQELFAWRTVYINTQPLMETKYTLGFWFLGVIFAIITGSLVLVCKIQMIIDGINELQFFGTSLLLYGDH